MSSLMRIQALAANTFREAIRNKLLYTLLGFGILMIGSGVLLATLVSHEGPQRFASLKHFDRIDNVLLIVAGLIEPSFEAMYSSMSLGLILLMGFSPK